jgi:hypothetical protein
MPSRLGEYERLLQHLLDANYEFITIEHFAQLVRKGEPLPELSVILRHDVDSDHQTVAAMHQIEAHLGLVASYYFRLCTADYELMQEIASQGSEASYHFEELATVAKRRALRNTAAAYHYLHEAQELFRDNLSQMRAKTGLAMRVVAAHGDFINRRLKIANHALLVPELRNELGIFAEAYDEDLARPITTRVSDCQPPQFWRPTSPDDAIESRCPCIYILVHPNHWRANVRTNLQATAVRVWEDVSYKIRFIWLKRSGS